MAFVQIIEFSTSRFEEVQAVGQEWEAAAGDSAKVRRRLLCRDRDQPDRYCNVVFFDSYEDAMANSDLPVTAEFSQRLMALADGPPTFHNLDVLEDVGP
jgi:hypothetical protein